jgi:hypothetical protein
MGFSDLGSKENALFHTDSLICSEYNPGDSIGGKLMRMGCSVAKLMPFVPWALGSILVCLAGMGVRSASAGPSRIATEASVAVGKSTRVYDGPDADELDPLKLILERERIEREPHDRARFAGGGLEDGHRVFPPAARHDPQLEIEVFHLASHASYFCQSMSPSNTDVPSTEHSTGYLPLSQGSRTLNCSLKSPPL